jgi:hypothetical protein
MLMVKVSYEENYTYSEQYGMVCSDRLVIYSGGKRPIDMGELLPLIEGKEYYENAFYE